MAREKREIRGEDVLKDLRSGMKPLDLMKKYRITSRGLNSVLKKLAAAGAISPVEFEGLSPLDEVRPRARKRDRSSDKLLKIPLIISEKDRPEAKGFVQQISEKEISVEGLETGVGAERFLKVHSSELSGSQTFVFQAVCRWVKREEDDEPVSGFEITRITQSALKELRKLL